MFERRELSSGAGLTEESLLRELVADPDPLKFDLRMRRLGVLMVEAMNRETPVAGRNFHVVCAIADVDGFAAGVDGALRGLGASTSHSIHHYEHELIPASPLVKTTNIAMSFHEVYCEPSTVIMASSCVGNTDRIAMSLACLMSGPRRKYDRGIVVMTPIAVAIAEVELLAKVPPQVRHRITWQTLAIDNARVPYGLPIPGVGGDPDVLSWRGDEPVDQGGRFSVMMEKRERAWKPQSLRAAAL
jgi:hypothetical protein